MFIYVADIKSKSAMKGCRKDFAAETLWICSKIYCTSAYSALKSTSAKPHNLLWICHCRFTCRNAVGNLISAFQSHVHLPLQCSLYLKPTWEPIVLPLYIILYCVKMQCCCERLRRHGLPAPFLPAIT